MTCNVWLSVLAHKYEALYAALVFFFFFSNFSSTQITSNAAPEVSEVTVTCSWEHFQNFEK